MGRSSVTSLLLVLVAATLSLADSLWSQTDTGSDQYGGSCLTEERYKTISFLNTLNITKDINDIKDDLKKLATKENLDNTNNLVNEYLQKLHKSHNGTGDTIDGLTTNKDIVYLNNILIDMMVNVTTGSKDILHLLSEATKNVIHNVTDLASKSVTYYTMAEINELVKKNDKLLNILNDTARLKDQLSSVMAKSCCSKTRTDDLEGLQDLTEDIKPKHERLADKTDVENVKDNLTNLITKSAIDHLQGSVVGVIKDGLTTMIYNIISDGNRLSKLLGITRTDIKEEVFEKTYPCKTLQGILNLDVQCIKVITYSGSWEEHHRKCLEIGGSGLLEITEERLPLLQHYLKRVDEFNMWIGGRKNEEGRFAWPSGRNMSLTWGWNNVNTIFRNGHSCTVIKYYEGGTFVTRRCSRSLDHSLCEMTRAADGITDSDTVDTDEIQEETEQPTRCGGNSTNGIIRHPLSGDSYQNNEHCTWIIREEKGIKMTFVSFATEEGHDYLSVRDGESLGSNVLGNFTGGSVPSEIQTSTSEAHLVFTSDYSRTGAGFELRWEPSVCGGEYNSSRGRIRHPVFNHSHYKNYDNCIWIIRSDVPIVITFVSFNTEEDAYLVVRDGDDESIESPVLGTYSGRGLFGPVQTTTSSAHLFFSPYSDRTELINRTGFELTWEPLDPCMESFFTLDGQCIKVINKEGSWDTHLDECLDIGGSQLLEITEERLQLLQPDLKRIYDSITMDSRTETGRSHNTEVRSSTTWPSYTKTVSVDTTGTTDSVTMDSSTETGRSHITEVRSSTTWPSYTKTVSVDTTDTTAFAVWIGGRKNEDAKFNLSSVQNVSWGWSSEEPTNVGGNDNCMTIASEGSFNVSTCDRSLGHSLCEMLPYSHISKEFGATRNLTTNLSFCGGEYNSSSGRIRHPPSGGNYQNNEHCSWIIRTTHNITITFDRFATEEGFDYLYVRDGESIDSQVLGNYTGNSVPNPILTNIMGAHLVFTSDHTRTGVGFELTWGPQEPCEKSFYNIDGQCIKLITHEGSWDSHLAKCLTRGGSQLFELRNSINSANNYLKQKVKHYDVWVGGRRNKDGRFKWPSGRNVNLNWGWSYGEPNNADGNEDCITFSGEFNDFPCDGHRGHSVCEMLPFSHYPKKSDETTMIKQTGCGGEYNSSIGMIRHPISGGKYQDNASCIWIIRTSEPIVIKLVSFDTEKNYDFLYVRDGASIGSRVLNTFTGKYGNYEIYKKTDTVYLHFTSDYSNTRTGFELTWEPSGCGGEYSSSSGRIRYPLRTLTYRNNAVCVWIIRAAEPITITFVRFSLENDYDYLYIRDGDSSTLPVMATLTGYSIPSPINTSSTAAHLRFRSDADGGKTGFELYWGEPPSEVEETTLPSEFTTYSEDDITGTTGVMWSETTNACIMNNNDEQLIGISTIEICKQKCIEQTDFVCRSIEYFADWDQRCWLSSATSRSQDYTEPCPVSGNTAFSEILSGSADSITETEPSYITNVDETTLSSELTSDSSYTSGTNDGYDKVWSDKQCSNVGNNLGKSLSECISLCGQTPGCTAINVRGGSNPDCVLRACALPIPPPEWTVASYKGYAIRAGQQQLGRLIQQPGWTEEQWQPTTLEPTTTTTSELATTEPQPPEWCEHPYQLKGKGCYLFVDDDWKSFDEANTICQSHGGVLASPGFLKDLQDHLQLYYYDTFWIGGQYDTNRRRWYWPGGRSISSGWRSGAPQEEMSKRCVCLDASYSYELNNDDCDTKYPFICSPK